MYGSKHVLTQAKLVTSFLPNFIKDVQHEKQSSLYTKYHLILISEFKLSQSSFTSNKNLLLVAKRCRLADCPSSPQFFYQNPPANFIKIFRLVTLVKDKVRQFVLNHYCACRSIERSTKLIELHSNICKKARGLYFKLCRFVIYGKWTYCVLRQCFFVLSVICSGWYKHTSLLRNLYTTNL